ncbi:MAG TPA: PRC-barrel domain-containing protein [Gemmatimonas sp.]|nr:PRC-barrel domain-containing protein [Gemmatimonas sp.]
MNRSNDEHGNQHNRVSPTGGGSGRLTSLHDLKDYKVADGEPDVRGWTVKTIEGVKIGKVVDLVVDLEAMKVRFLKIVLNHDTLDLKDDRNVLVPISVARLNDDEDLVILNKPAGEIINLPAYTEGYDSPDFDRPHLATTAMADDVQNNMHNDMHDDRQFFGNRRQGREDEKYFVAVPETTLPSSTGHTDSSQQPSASPEFGRRATDHPMR